MNYRFVSITPCHSSPDHWVATPDGTDELIYDLTDFLFNLDGVYADLRHDIPYWAEDILGLIYEEPDMVYAYQDRWDHVYYFGFDLV
jgi:hypothetical protein